MKVVLVMFKDGERRDFPLSAVANVVGRKSDCALRIPTADVSRQHCEIKVLDDEITVRDLGSANGTYVNGKRIAEAILKPGDELAIGPAKFFVQVNGEPAEFEPPEESGTDSGGSDVIVLGEDDLFLLEDDDIGEDDAISALELMTDDDDKDDDEKPG